MADLRGRQRVLAFGCGGAAKTMLSRELARVTGLSLIQDRYHWHPGWIPTPEDEWSRRVARALMLSMGWDVHPGPRHH